MTSVTPIRPPPNIQPLAPLKNYRRKLYPMQRSPSLSMAHCQESIPNDVVLRRKSHNKNTAQRVLPQCFGPNSDEVLRRKRVLQDVVRSAASIKLKAKKSIEREQSTSQASQSSNFNNMNNSSSDTSEDVNDGGSVSETLPRDAYHPRMSSQHNNDPNPTSLTHQTFIEDEHMDIINNPAATTSIHNHHHSHHHHLHPGLVKLERDPVLTTANLPGPSGTQKVMANNASSANEISRRQSADDGPTAPDLQLDCLSSNSSSEDTDDDSGIEIVSVQFKQPPIMPQVI